MGLSPASNVDDAPFPEDVDADLPRPRAGIRDRLPIGRVETTLDRIELKPRISSGSCREPPEVHKAGAQEVEGLHPGQL